MLSNLNVTHWAFVEEVTMNLNLLFVFPVNLKEHHHRRHRH